jgi:hypothetical protein
VTATIARAAELVGAGRYDHAERMLQEFGGHESTDPDVLDLLARIHAQRGELAEADECWARAERTGDAAAARRSRTRIAALQTDHMRRHPARIAVALVAAGAIGVGGVALIPRHPAVAPSVLARMDDLQRGQQDQAARLDTLAGRVDDPAIARRAVFQRLAAAVTADPALQWYSRSGTLTVTFPHGMFTAGTDLAPTGTAVLDRLGRLLDRFGPTLSVTVIGHTEDTAPSPALSAYRPLSSEDVGLPAVRHDVGRAVAGGEQGGQQLCVAGVRDLDLFRLRGRQDQLDRVGRVHIDGLGRPLRGTALHGRDDREPVRVQSAGDPLPLGLTPLGQFDGDADLDIGQQAAQRSEQLVVGDLGQAPHEHSQVLGRAIDVVEHGQPLGGLPERGDLGIGRLLGGLLGRVPVQCPEQAEHIANPDALQPGHGC